MLELTCAVHPVTGKFINERTRLETTHCEHCCCVIAIHVEGCSRDYQSKFTCGRCHGMICKLCAKAMHDNRGICPGPFVAAVEEAVKRNNGHLLSRGAFRYRYRT